MKILKYKFQVNELNKDKINYKNLNNKNINFINVEFKKRFVHKYINNSFEIALFLHKKNNNINIINGSKNKKKILKQKFLRVTEYLDFKTKSKGNVAMLIYNKSLSVSPITTHLPLKKVHKNINKAKIINHVKLITKFYKEVFEIKPRIGITGLNPHCESNYDQSEEDKIISPAIRYLSKKKYKVNGPFPADTIFLKDKLKNEYNCVFWAINQFLDSIIYQDFHLEYLQTMTNIDMFLKNPTSLIKAIKFLDK